MSGCAYAEACLQRRDWAYLSDYVRLQVLAKEGGVYLDTDVELLKSLDGFMDGPFHIGYMHNCALRTAIMISPANHFLLARLIVKYQAIPPRSGHKQQRDPDGILLKTCGGIPVERQGLVNSQHQGPS